MPTNTISAQRKREKEERASESFSDTLAVEPLAPSSSPATSVPVPVPTPHDRTVCCLASSIRSWAIIDTMSFTLTSALSSALYALPYLQYMKGCHEGGRIMKGREKRRRGEEGEERRVGGKHAAENDDDVFEYRE